VILLDTHIWIWWVADESRLSAAQLKYLRDHESIGLGVSVISCWEVANLARKGKVKLDRTLEDWVPLALAYPGVRLVNLSPDIVVASTALPGTFHRDPADRILVATARAFDIPILTVDAKILAYPHVRTLT
jgi:PIN domain nuclease of toxin-antitoxin system